MYFAAFPGMVPGSAPPGVMRPLGDWRDYIDVPALISSIRESRRWNPRAGRSYYGPIRGQDTGPHLVEHPSMITGARAERSPFRPFGQIPGELEGSNEGTGEGGSYTPVDSQGNPVSDSGSTSDSSWLSDLVSPFLKIGQQAAQRGVDILLGTDTQATYLKDAQGRIVLNAQGQPILVNSSTGAVQTTQGAQQKKTDWLMPAAIGAGVLVLATVLMKRR